MSVWAAWQEREIDGFPSSDLDPDLQLACLISNSSAIFMNSASAGLDP